MNPDWKTEATNSLAASFSENFTKQLDEKSEFWISNSSSIGTCGCRLERLMSNRVGQYTQGKYNSKSIIIVHLHPLCTSVESRFDFFRKIRYSSKSKALYKLGKVESVFFILFAAIKGKVLLSGNYFSLRGGNPLVFNVVLLKHLV